VLIRQALRFFVVGVAATSTHFLVMLFSVEALRLDPVAATFPAFAIAFLVSYGLNRTWTFAATDKHLALITRYLLLALSGMLLNALIMHVAVHVLGWSYLVGFALGVVIVPVVSFTGARWLVFRAAGAGRDLRESLPWRR
jgi:putative flippase GtrA